MSGHSKWNNIKRKKEKTDAAKAKIAEAVTEEDILAAVAEAKAEMDAIETKEAIVNAALVEVDAYKADVVYLEEQAAARVALIATAKETIQSATAKAAIDTAVTDMKAAIDQLKTKDQVEAEAFAAYKATANATVDSLKKAIDFDLYVELETVDLSFQGTDTLIGVLNELLSSESCIYRHQNDVVAQVQVRIE